MIDYFSLALGHGLLAIALLRLVMREDVDVDPRLNEIAETTESTRNAATNAGRASRRPGGDTRGNTQGNTRDSTSGSTKGETKEGAT